MLIAGRTIQPVYSYALDGSYQEQPRPDIPLPQIAEDSYILGADFDLLHTPLINFWYREDYPEEVNQRYVRILGLLTNFNIEEDPRPFLPRLREELIWLQQEMPNDYFVELAGERSISSALLAFEIATRLYDLDYVEFSRVETSAIAAYETHIDGAMDFPITTALRIAERGIGYGVGLEASIYRDFDYLLSEDKIDELEYEEMIDMLRLLTAMLEENIPESDRYLDQVLGAVFSGSPRNVIYVLREVYEWSRETYGQDILPRPILTRIYYLLNDINSTNAILISYALEEMGIEGADILLERSLELREQETQRIISLRLDLADQVRRPSIPEIYRRESSEERAVEPEETRNVASIRSDYEEALRARDYIFAINYAAELIQAEDPEAMSLLERAGSDGFEFFMTRRRFAEAFFIAEQMQQNGVEQSSRMVAESAYELYHSFILSNQASRGMELLVRVRELGVDEPEIEEIRNLHIEYLHDEHRIAMDQCRYGDAIDMAEEMISIDDLLGEERLAEPYEALLEQAMQEQQGEERLKSLNYILWRTSSEDGLSSLTLSLLDRIYDADPSLGNRVLDFSKINQMRTLGVEGLDLWISEHLDIILARDMSLQESFRMAHALYELNIEGSHELLERSSIRYMDYLLAQEDEGLIRPLEIAEIMRDANVERADEYYELARQIEIERRLERYQRNLSGREWTDAILDTKELLRLNFPYAENLAQSVIIEAVNRYFGQDDILENFGRLGIEELFKALGFMVKMDGFDSEWARDIHRRTTLLCYEQALQDQNYHIIMELGRGLLNIDKDLANTMLTESRMHFFEIDLVAGRYGDAKTYAEMLINNNREVGEESFVRVYTEARDSRNYEQAFQISNAMLRLQVSGAKQFAQEAIQNLIEHGTPSFSANGYNGILNQGLEIALNIEIRDGTQFIYNGIRYTVHLVDQEDPQQATFLSYTRDTDVFLYNSTLSVRRRLFHEIVEDQFKRFFRNSNFNTDRADFTQHTIAFGLEDEFFPQRVAVNGHGLNLLYTISAESIDPDIVIDMIFRNSFSRSEELSNRSRYPNLENEQRTSDIRTHIREGLRGPRSGESAANYIEQIFRESRRVLIHFALEQRISIAETRRLMQRIRSLRETRETENWRRHIRRR